MQNSPYLCETIKDYRLKKHITTFARELRKEMTESEKILWKELRGRRFHNLKFRRQSPIGGYIPDFLCLELRLIIEIDGSVHQVQEQKEYDAQRERGLKERGYVILRFSNDQVKHSLQMVLNVIWETARGTTILYSVPKREESLRERLARAPSSRPSPPLPETNLKGNVGRT